MKKFKLAIIGGGPGGYVSAIRGAQLGMEVALIERDKVGGICLHKGCIPVKSLIESVHLFSKLKKRQEFGIEAENVSFNIGKAIERCVKISESLEKGIEFLLKKRKIVFIKGEGKIISEKRIKINGEEIEADRIIIASGSKPRLLSGIKNDGEKIITSDDAVRLKNLPNSIVIIGGGAVGIEFAYIYSNIGVKITLIERNSHILPREDKEAIEILERALKRQGIEIIKEGEIEDIKTDKLIAVKVNTPKGIKEIRTESLFIAIGREGNVEDLGAKELGIEMDKGFIKVNDKFETNIKDIYAIGDVIGEPMLAHIASAQGISIVESIAGIDKWSIDYENIPFCVYTYPNFSSIGLTEEKARKRGHKIKIGKFTLRANGRAKTYGEEEGLIKVVADSEYGEILGVHVVGVDAPEIAGEIALARNLEGTVREIGKTIYAHPSISEALMEASLDVDGEAIHF
jgi:dihydrolipoamide dehydrogenase